MKRLVSGGLVAGLVAGSVLEHVQHDAVVPEQPHLVEETTVELSVSAPSSIFGTGGNTSATSPTWTVRAAMGTGKRSKA